MWNIGEQLRSAQHSGPAGAKDSVRRTRVAIALTVLLSARATSAAELSASRILDEVDDLYLSTTSQGLMEMDVTTPHWSRQLRLRFFSKGRQRLLVRITSPEKDRGTATLRNGNDLWNYLPKVDRTIKVPAAMLGGSWMGSDFTNNDLVKQQRMADDYQAAITFAGERSGAKIVEVTAMPKPEAPVVWEK